MYEDDAELRDALGAAIADAFATPDLAPTEPSLIAVRRRARRRRARRRVVTALSIIVFASAAAATTRWLRGPAEEHRIGTEPGTTTSTMAVFELGHGWQTHGVDGACATVLLRDGVERASESESCGGTDAVSVTVLDANHAWIFKAMDGGSDGHVRRSEDGGRTWETFDTTPGLQAAAFVSADIGVARTFWGDALYRTEDGGEHWADMTDRVVGALGHTEFRIQGIAARGQRLVMTVTAKDGSDETELSSPDTGRTWTLAPPPDR